MIRRRRLRATENLRALVRETSVSVSDLIYPLFVIEGNDIKNPIDSMPGIYQYSLDRIDEELDRIREAGVKGVLLFGIPAHKDECGTEAYNEHGIIQEAIRYIKKVFPELVVIADICLCEYTSHGHCGLIKDGIILNDETLPLLAKTAVTCAQAGADMVAPSDMMDGRITAIRQCLDSHGHLNTPIMSYAVKFASAYYGPFRDAADSAPQFGNRRTYQMDYHNRREAVKEALADINEGADIIMVKPAMIYGDLIREIKDRTNVPMATYSVSGEYAMIKGAASLGLIDEDAIICETAIAAKRAGADIYITYFAEELAGFIKQGLL